MNVKKTEDNALNAIHSALTILEDNDKYTDISNDSGFNFNVNISPFDLILEIVRMCGVDTDEVKDGVNGVYDIVIGWICEFLQDYIPILDSSVKGLLTTSLRNLLNCTLNPIISEEVLTYGILFDLKEVDIFNHLYTTPTYNSPYYFDIQKEGTRIINEKQILSTDFNLLLWYLINVGKGRVVWGGRTVWYPNKKQKKIEDVFPHTNKVKTNRSEAIITLEFHSNTENILNAEGGNMINAHIPDRNCLQVFIGNALPDNNADIDFIRDTHEEIIQKISNNDTDDIETLKKSLDKKYKYTRIVNNEYYNRTYYEFCWNYIWSLTLFDYKTLIARTLDCIFNYTSINLNASWEKILLQEEVKNLVKKTIETDDVVVNDCFFNFDNDTYNDLMERSEKIYKGLYVSDDNSVSKNIDIANLLENLNKLDDNSTKEERTTIIKGVIYGASGLIANPSSDEDYKFNSNTNFSFKEFTENLLNNLTYAICEVIFSPKVHLILMITKKIIGKNENANTQTILQEFKKLIVDLIRMIRDKLLEYLVSKVKELLKPIVEKLMKKISLEQMTYYYSLIRRAIDCFTGFKGERLGWSAENITYADIYDTVPSPPSEC